MEYEEGEDLDHWLARRSNVTEAQLVTKILLPVLDGLEKVHAKQLLHRDIKPGNIFIRTDGTPVLIDFGASRAHGASAATNVTTIVSAGYSPFEQYGGGNTRQGPWTDLYALAGTMYRAIAGQPPVDVIARMQGQAMTPAVDVGRGRYSEDVLGAIDRALSLDPKDRPQSVAEFRSLITGGGADAPTRALDANDKTVVRRGPPPDVGTKKSRVAPVIGALAVVLLGLGGAGWYFVLGPGKPGAPTPPPVVTPEPIKEGPPANQSVANESTEAPAQPEATTDTAPQVVTVEPAEQVAETPPPEPVNQEDVILEGLGMPPDIYKYRESHIAGTLLAYVQTKQQFDECQKAKCKDMATLMQATIVNQEGSWRKPDFCEGDACEYSGTVRITNPRRLDREGCPFLIDVTEELRHAGTVRKQVRTYCTDNGFNRTIDHVEPVT
jgi:hypothetical protein